MKLSKAAAFFNKTPFLDAYSGALVCLGQLQPYTDNTRDSMTGERRIGSFLPGAPTPARGVFRVGAQHFIVGDAHTDVHKGVAVRSQVVLHEAPMDVQIRTLAEVCVGHAGRLAKGNKVWVKDLAFTEQSSALVPEYRFALSRTEAIAPHQVLTTEGVSYLVRSTTVGSSGVQTPLVEQLPLSAIRQVELRTASFDKIQGKALYASVLSQAVILRWQSLFEYGSKSAPTYGPSDIVVVLPSSVSVTVGSQVLLGPLYRVASVDTADGVHVCGCVRHEV